MIIRPATPDDNASVTELLEASYPALMRNAYEAGALELALPLITKANPALLSSGTFYVAETEAGEVVGCGGWTWERPGTGKVSKGLAHIRHFATHPNHTGQGIGKAIYGLCEQEARSSGVSTFECYSSLNAEGFYAALGFERVKRIKVPMKRGFRFSSIQMMRDI